MPEKDVTRRAVELAAKTVSRVKDNLFGQITTGPTKVRMTPGEIKREIERGNTRMLRHAMEIMDEDQLLRLMNG
jgi:hypothetical protein